MSLVLTRYSGEELIIAEEIKIKVISLSKRKVVLAIDASRHITVDRLEIYLKKQKNPDNEI